MTSVLRDLQAGYDQRAWMALQAPPEPLERAARPKATRTYTGQALERRRAWGGLWTMIQKQQAAKMYEAERM